MRLPVITAYADWLAGVDLAAGKGVNDFLELVPRHDLDPEPPRPIALFADPFRNEKALAFDTPSAHPALYVLPDGPVTAEGEARNTDRRSQSVGVAARLIIGGDTSTVKQARYAEYVLRAMAMSTALFLADDEPGRLSRTKMNTVIVSANRIAFGPWKEAVGESQAIAVFAVDFEVRDQKPRG